LDDLEDMFHLKSDDKRLQLLFERDSSVSQYIYTDEVKVRQVLINLLNNALKFTVEGGITVRVNAKTIVQTDLNQQQAVIEFEVEDTGPGIAPDELDDLFKAFVQTATGKQSQEGTGLGLPISRKFVQLMGGDIVVTSEVGRGTTFQFQIQCQLSEATQIKKPAHEKHVIALAPNQPRYRILIVDDKWPSRQLLIKLLNPLGFELKEAENGQQAIETWEEWQPHLIWMDMRMPVMNGYEATQKIREHTKGQATAIVALTASVLEEERAVILDAGCDDFLRKPFKENDIFDLMHKHIGVKYVYEDSGEVVESEGDEETKIEDLKSEIVQLPSDLLAKLQEFVETADLQAILPLIDVIGESNKPLANTLTKLVNGFRFDILQEVFED
jgi:CheY-like chemotaxis protein